MNTKCSIPATVSGKKVDMYIYVTGVSYKWYASVAGLPYLYSVIDGLCTLKVENKCYTENTFYMKQAVLYVQYKIYIQHTIIYIYLQIEVNLHSSKPICKKNH